MAFQIGMMAAGVGIGLVLAIIGIFIGAAFLWVSARVFKLHDRSFTTPLIIAAIAGVVGYVLGLIPVINRLSWVIIIVLTVWLIKSRYRVGWGTSILVWLAYFILSIAVMAGIMLLFFGGVMAGGMMGMFG
jgi:hypothetical protein